jgi:hypothetical protein
MSKLTPTILRTKDKKNTALVQKKDGGNKLPKITHNAKLFGNVQRYIIENFPVNWVNHDTCDHIASINKPTCVKCGQIVIYN